MVYVWGMGYVGVIDFLQYIMEVFSMRTIIKELFYATSRTGALIFDKLSTGIFLGIGFATGVEIYEFLTEVFSK